MPPLISIFEEDEQPKESPYPAAQNLTNRYDVDPDQTVAKSTTTKKKKKSAENRRRKRRGDYLGEAMRKGGGQVGGEEREKKEDTKRDEGAERSRLGGGGEMARHGRKSKTRSPVAISERTNQ